MSPLLVNIGIVLLFVLIFLAVAEMGLSRHRASNDARALQRALVRAAVPAH